VVKGVTVLAGEVVAIVLAEGCSSPGFKVIARMASPAVPSWWSGPGPGANLPESDPYRLGLEIWLRPGGRARSAHGPRRHHHRCNLGIPGTAGQHAPRLGRPIPR
jgi:hypothetical protein